jgi:Cytochrome C oxidase, mono-heme subunit/FixO
VLQRGQRGSYSLAVESKYDHPMSWSSKRTGSDLARDGLGRMAGRASQQLVDEGVIKRYGASTTVSGFGTSSGLIQLAWPKCFIEDMPDGRVGRVQRGARRALITLWPKPVRVSDLLEWSYPRIDKPRAWHRTAVHRAVRRWAIVVGKAGRANLWMPNAELARLIDPPRQNDSDT